MEELITHYRNINEVFTKEIEVEEEMNPIKISLPSSSEVFVYSKLPNKEKKTVYLTEDELKAAMSANESVLIKRDTLIVSENLLKNTISIKRYHFTKKFVTVKNSKRKYFKILKQSMCGLSINKDTGDYYIYHTNRPFHGKKQSIIRKNIMNGRLKRLLYEILSPAGGLTTQEGQSIFYELLGYQPILDYQKFIKYWLHTKTLIDPTPTNSIIVFPFINLLLKQEIQLPKYHELYIFEYLFKIDKKLFSKNRSSLHDIIKHKYKISDDRVIKKVLTTLDSCAEQHYEDTIAAFSTKKRSLNTSSFPHIGLDSFTLSNCSKFNLSEDDINSLQLLTINRFNEIVNDFYEDEVFKFYNFSIRDINIFANAKFDIKHDIEILYYFKLFNIKLKFDNLELIDKNIKLINKLFDLLCYTRSKTGTVIIDPNFMNMMKKKLGANTKVGIKNECRIRPRNRINNEFLERNLEKLITRDDYEELYDKSGTLPWVYVIKENKPEYSFRLNFKIGSLKTHGSHNNDIELYMLTNILGINDKNILSKVGIKQIYSRKYFEELVHKILKINPEEYIEYLN